VIEFILFISYWYFY